MNCECIYYARGASRQDYIALAKRIERMSEEIEFYPTAISVMNQKTECCENYDGWGKTTSIPKGKEVLFVGGKLVYMHDIRNGGLIFHAWHPVEHDIDFTDVETFD